MRLIGVVLFISLVVGAGCVLLKSSFSYADQDREHISAGSSAQHRTGTDELGRDRTVRTAGAMLIGVAGAVCAAAIAASIAVSTGVVAAFATSLVSKSLMYACDLFLTLPWIFMLMIVRASLPLTLSPAHSALLTFLLLGLLGAPVFVRMNYMRALAIRRAGWLVQARASGLSIWRLTGNHVLPHLRPLFLTQFLIYVPVGLIAEANLGALGLGISQPLPSWGSMLVELQNSILLAGSHWVYLPMVLMILLLFALEMTVMEREV